MQRRDENKPCSVPTSRINRIKSHLSTGLHAPLRASVASMTHHAGVSQQYSRVTPTIVAQLKQCVSDPERVVNSTKDIALNSKDHSFHDDAPPEVVVYALSTEEVSKVASVCHKAKVPITACGARTGLEGACIPILGGVAVNLSRMNNIIKYYPDELNVTVEPGVKKDALNKFLSSHGMFFPVDPASNPSLGGMASTGSSGTLTVKYGTMKENVVSLTVVLADGRIVTTRRRTRKNSTGYDLTHLFMGQEGTLGIITQLTVRVLPTPQHICAALVTFPTMANACQAVALMLRSHVAVARCELMNTTCVQCVNKYFKSSFAEKPLLLLEFHGSSEAFVRHEAEKAQTIAEQCRGLNFEFNTDEAERERMWKARRGAYFAMLNGRPRPEKGKRLKALITDVCVPLSELPKCMEETEQDFANCPHDFLCGIVGHVGDGNFHLMVPFIPTDPQEAKDLEELNVRLQMRALRCGGTVSGEHGVGLGKVLGASKEHGEVTLSLFKDIKRTLDPHGILNPGKLFP